MRGSHLNKTRKSLVVAALAVTAMMLSVSTLSAADGLECIPAIGHLTDHVTANFPDLTTEGTITGILKGTYRFAITRQLPTSKDTPQTLFFTADSSIETRLGTISIKEAGVVDSQTGNLVDLWTITGGTGSWTGATGQIFAGGNFNLAAGTAAVVFEGPGCRQ